MGVALLLAALVPVSSFATPIYVYKDKNGSTRFSNKPPPAGVRAEVFSPRRASFSIMRHRGVGGMLFLDRFTQFIEAAAKRYDIEEALLRAVIHAESAFNPKAVSPKGAQGLMQLMPPTARELGVSDAFSPEQNIDGGARYLAGLLARYKGDERLALAAYNAGEEAVKRFGGVPPFRETQEYVPKVLELRRRYRAALRRHS